MTNTKTTDPGGAAAPQGSTNVSVSDGPAGRPRNHLGQPATRTPGETIARLKEKIFKNHGGANRERIQTRISEEMKR